MSEEQISEHQLRTAMQSPQHLQRWLQETNRKYLVFDSQDLIQSLPWPDGVNSLIQIISCYQQHRQAIESGRTETQVEPLTKNEIQVPIYKSDRLELNELDRCIRYLIGMASDLDPNWSLDNPGM